MGRYDTYILVWWKTAGQKPERLSGLLIFSDLGSQRVSSGALEFGLCTSLTGGTSEADGATYRWLPARPECV